MRARPVVIFLVRLEQMTKVPFAKYNDMVKTFLPDRSDEPLRTSVLPATNQEGLSILGPEETTVPIPGMTVVRIICN